MFQESIKEKPNPQIMLDAERLSKWLSEAMQSNKFKSLFGVKYDENQAIYNQIGGMLITYGISTRDLTNESAERVLSAIADSGIEPDYAYDSQADKNVFLGRVKVNEGILARQIAQQIKLSIPLSDDKLKSMELIIQTVSENCEQKGFYTHSFNGGLIPIIDNQGLDISNEMFKEGYEAFGRIGRDSLWTTGQICLTPSSSMSFHYCHNSPERFLAGPLNGTGIKRMQGESTEKYYKRKLDTMLNQKHYKIENKTPKEFLSTKEFEHTRSLGLEMCEFYGKPITSGISIIPKQIFGEPQNKKNPDMQYSVVDSFMFGKNSLELSATLWDSIKNYLRDTIGKVRSESETRVARELYTQIVKETNANGKAEDLSALIEEVFLSEVIGYTDYDRADGFGVKVEGGKVPRDMFAIAEVPEIDNLTAEKQRLEVRPFLSFEIKDGILGIRNKYEKLGTLNSIPVIKALDNLMIGFSRAWTPSSVVSDKTTVNPDAMKSGQDKLVQELRTFYEAFMNKGGSAAELKAVELLIEELSVIPKTMPSNINADKEKQ